jgi:hypothetical protein
MAGDKITCSIIETENPKFEARNPKEPENPNVQTA